ncbi:hypothetical protein GGI15_004367 [Coemansia interrupta]|uniref:Uncharacterized protein n=1 Tax=Coemansia interrupta TaxID=1126814 RepID=A0A9W8H6I4_9FUNG|nr:hypothetical protein GGI15_004367 [Coemansia interrupta]
MLRIAATKTARSATTRMALTQTSARRHSSHDSHDHHSEHGSAQEHHTFEEEGFNSPLWKYSIGAIGAFYLIGKYDDYVEKSGRVHPLTKLYASIMTDKADNRRIFSEYQAEVAKKAEFNILQWEEKRHFAGAMDTATYHKRSAKWGVPVGTEVDMSGAKNSTPIKE